jgi:hypothetical protein
VKINSRVSYPLPGDDNLARFGILQEEYEAANLQKPCIGGMPCRYKQSFRPLTPHAYVLRLRLELAQNLTLTTDDPLSQIALSCGLADQAHLSKLFRRTFHDTPNASRRRNLTEAGDAATNEAV